MKKYLVAQYLFYILLATLYLWSRIQLLFIRYPQRMEKSIEAKKIRKLARRKQFQRNRELISNICHQNVFDSYHQHFQENDGSHLDSYVDPRYFTLIKILNKSKFELFQIERLVQSLQNQDYFGIYQSMIGLNSLERNYVYNSQVKQTIFNLGAVAKLNKILRLTQHPFLQVKGGKILSSLINGIGTTMHQFIRESFLKVDTFFILLASEEDEVILVTLSLMGTCISHGYDFDCRDRKQQLLPLFDRIFLKWKLANNLKGLQKFWNLIREMSYFITNDPTSEGYFAIVDQLLHIFSAANHMGVVQSIFGLISKSKLKIKTICSILKNSDESLKLNLFAFLKSLYNLKNNIYSKEVIDNWSTLLINFISYPDGLAFLMSIGLPDFLQIYMISEENFSSKQLVISACITVIGAIFSKTKNKEVIDIFVGKVALWKKMMDLCSSYNKKMAKSLNDTICAIISAGHLFDIKKMLQQYLLLDKFFEKINNFDNMFAKMALKKLRDSLIDLHNSATSPEPYEFAVQMVTKAENTRMIKAIQERNYCDGISQITNYFMRLMEVDSQIMNVIN